MGRFRSRTVRCGAVHALGLEFGNVLGRGRGLEGGSGWGCGWTWSFRRGGGEEMGRWRSRGLEFGVWVEELGRCLGLGLGWDEARVVGFG